jgi:Ca2+-binding RTX toxin-like protein
MPNFLNGANGSNVYQYNLGSGDTIITETGSGNDVDTLVLSGAGLTAANIIVSRSGTSNQLKITFKNIPGSIVLEDQLYGNYGIERLIFSDGTVWNESQLWESYLNLAADTDDRLDGDVGNNSLIGGKGNDVMDGGSGSDTYTYRLGDGDDTLADTGSSNDVDHLVFSGAGLTAANAVVTRIGTTNNLKITFKNIAGSIVLKDQLYSNYGVEKITFGDGTVWNESQLWESYLNLAADTDDRLDGTIGNNSLIGGKGNDVMDGGSGSDTYTYRLGDGNDTIADTGFSNDVDH